MSGLLLRGLATGVPPAVAAEVRTPAGLVCSAAGGWARLARAGAPAVAADAGALSDLASLTKVVATLPLRMSLHRAVLAGLLGCWLWVGELVRAR